MSDHQCQAKRANQSTTEVVCTIVTYADRRALLLSVLDSLPEQGVTRVVVVDNGAHWQVQADLSDRYGDFVDVVEMGRNSGSAGGFTAGIQRALDLGAEYIWLLDDDNRPAADCLDALLAAYHRLRADNPTHHIAVLAFRPEHQPDLAAGVPLHRINPRRSAFRGFHIFDLPYKFWRRTPWGRPHVRGDLPELVDLYAAPYSGLLLHRTVAESIGLPREDFVLYTDDTEYTYRITQSGGRIALVTSAHLNDMESSWTVRRCSETTFSMLLKNGKDLQVYYGMRNGAYFDAYCRPNHRCMFWLNRWIYLSTLWMQALFTRRTDRCRLVMLAVKDGLAKRLKLHPRFPI